jgi:hypothetical protein
MPFVPVANTAMVELRYTWNLQQVENTLYFQYPTPPENANLFDITETIFDWWDTHLRPIQSNQVQLREVVATDLTTSDGQVFTRVSSPPVSGGNLAPALPNNCTYCISFRTFKRGRSFRGRNFSIGMTENDATNSQVDPAYATALQDAYVQIPALVNAVDWVWVVVSRFSNGAPRVAGLATPVATIFVFDGIMDSQRRRLPGRGV